MLRACIAVAVAQLASCAIGFPGLPWWLCKLLAMLADDLLCYPLSELQMPSLRGVLAGLSS